MEANILEMLGIVRHTTTSAAANIVDSRRPSASVVYPFPFMQVIHCFVDFCLKPFLLLFVESKLHLYANQLVQTTSSSDSIARILGKLRPIIFLQLCDDIILILHFLQFFHNAFSSIIRIFFFIAGLLPLLIIFDISRVFLPNELRQLRVCAQEMEIPLGILQDHINLELLVDDLILENRY